MLSPNILNDLNRTITESMLEQSIRDQLTSLATRPIGASLANPYGSNGEPVFARGEYIVPQGTVLVVTSGGNAIKVHDMFPSFTPTIRANDSSTVAIIPTGARISTLDVNNSISGMRFSPLDGIEALIGTTTYTVPADKILIITSSSNEVNANINGDTVRIRNANDPATVVPFGTVVSVPHQNYRWSGYLKNLPVDTVNPVIQLIGGTFITHEIGTEWTDPGLNAHDLRDGNLSSSVTVTGDVDTNSPGTYVITYTVTDAAGNQETTTRTVTISSFHNADLNASVQLQMLWVEPGTFTMGSPTTEADRQADRETEHNVSLTQGFYLGKYEVTQAQYEAVMTGNTDSLSATPSQWPNNPNRPVEKVSWADAQIFLTRLNAQQSANIPAGWAYVLPTESQWEYACRAGTSTVYSWGDDINATHANYSAGGLSQTRDVAQYSANPWGFFDMHGNVSEWTADRYQEAYPTGNPVVDPTGPASGPRRVLRGGSWRNPGAALRSADRYGVTPSYRIYSFGFRVGFKYTGHTVDLNSSVNLEMLWVEPGTFTMGSPTTEAGREADREDEHNVTLTKGFYLGKYEVTQAQYEAVMTGNTDSLSATPSQWPNNPNRPVEKVSWADAQIFLTRLNTQQSANIPAGWAYVLPTESQWEYACRAGTTTAYSWENDINSSRANYNWDGGPTDGNDFKQTRDVGQYAANPLGFFDMHGNVSEWTADWFQAAYPTGNPVVDPTGPASGSHRVFRGGSWRYTGTGLRSADRTYFPPSYRYDGVGFRVGFQKQ